MPARWGEELRRFPRISLKTLLHCQIRGKAEGNFTITRDIGLGGISFINEGFVAPNTCVNLEINILSRIVTTAGRIVRADSVPFSDKFKFGVEFIELEPLQKKHLSDYINMRLSGVSAANQ